MNSEGQVHRLIVGLNPRYTVRPCKWAGVPGFEEADAEAFAFVIGSVLRFKPRVLGVIAQEMSPLAIGILLWGASEIKRACGFSLDLKKAKSLCAGERVELSGFTGAEGRRT